MRLRLDPRLTGRLDPSDVLQDAFLDAARRLPEFVAAPSVPIWVWLRSLALQRIVDLHRTHLGSKMRSVARETPWNVGGSLVASTVTLSELLIDPAKSPASELAMREKHRRVQNALESMEPLDREVLAMRHFELLSNHEVAPDYGNSRDGGQQSIRAGYSAAQASPRHH